MCFRLIRLLLMIGPLMGQVSPSVAQHDSVTEKQSTPPASQSVGEPAAIVPLLTGTGPLESAPHGDGNIYAPDVHLDNGLYRMWYGAQGADGHDRILYAKSQDGQHWERQGVAVEDATANHINDPSAVKVDDIWYLYHTRAQSGVVDEIDLATSTDGRHWTLFGAVVTPGDGDQWDSLLVGRPTVIHEDGVFRMWYDGRKDLPLNVPSPGAPKSRDSRRSVGYATSSDGRTWTKHPASPVFGHNAGGIDVKRFGQTYLMLYESHSGTKAAVSDDGIVWKDRGLVVERFGRDLDAAGHVTPFLMLHPHRATATLYLGAAADHAWNHNSIAAVRFSFDGLRELWLDQ